MRPGDARKAALAKDELLKLQPGFTIDTYRKTWYSGTPAFFDLVDVSTRSGASFPISIFPGSTASSCCGASMRQDLGCR
jgi:hypothetical protein